LETIPVSLFLPHSCEAFGFASSVFYLSFWNSHWLLLFDLLRKPNSLFCFGSALSLAI